MNRFEYELAQSIFSREVDLVAAVAQLLYDKAGEYKISHNATNLSMEWRAACLTAAATIVTSNMERIS